MNYQNDLCVEEAGSIDHLHFPKCAGAPGIPTFVEFIRANQCKSVAKAFICLQLKAALGESQVDNFAALPRYSITNKVLHFCAKK